MLESFAYDGSLIHWERTRSNDPCPSWTFGFSCRRMQLGEKDNDVEEQVNESVESSGQSAEKYTQDENLRNLQEQILLRRRPFTATRRVTSYGCIQISLPAATAMTPVSNRIEE